MYNLFKTRGAKIMQKWQGKLKAVTFSFDDGVTQDKRLVEILNKYGLKATFRQKGVIP